MTTAIEWLKQGHKNEVWTKYCGFLDLSIAEFMKIQERLLLEQIGLAGRSPIGMRFLGREPPASVEEFRRRVPITSYQDYAPYLDNQLEEHLPHKPFAWAHTSGRSGRFKWVPYTELAYRKMGERVLAGIILAAARWKGDVRLEEGDVLVYNTPPRPYISGVVLQALAELFPFRFIPPLDKTEEMDFQERIQAGFESGLVTGIDVLGSLSVVLVKMGERFAEGAGSGKISRQMLHPSALARLLKGLVRSKIERRQMLPKDLWKLKALPCGGMDTAIYREKIAHYWGVLPYEQYGCSEEGAIATQAWNKKGLTFFPDAAFYEFIPQEEWERGQQDAAYQPRTVLLNEVEISQRYELVITNFYDKPFMRYRLNDLVEFPSLRDEETGVNLPQMVFVSRTSDLIDLAGFAGLIDEKMIWHAIVAAGVAHEDWILRKEVHAGEPFLHLYIEPKDAQDDEAIRINVHDRLKAANPFYGDYERNIAERALEVTVLPPGAFRAYMGAMHAQGVDLARLKPARMNAPDETIELLLKVAKEIRPNGEPLPG